MNSDWKPTFWKRKQKIYFFETQLLPIQMLLNYDLHLFIQGEHTKQPMNPWSLQRNTKKNPANAILPIYTTVEDSRATGTRVWNITRLEGHLEREPQGIKHWATPFMIHECSPSLDPMLTIKGLRSYKETLAPYILMFADKAPFYKSIQPWDWDRVESWE